PNSLFRTSSASSISSVDTQSSLDDVAVEGDAPRRTRKRFTSAQLMMLEYLYHQTSHPTREQREALARDAAIELRSVTVWFQNKRQTERKALHISVSLPDDMTPAETTLPTLIEAEALRTHHIHLPHLHRPQLSAARRPSLDHVATRAERERPHHDSTPRTPTRLRTYSTPHDPRSLWENMPSSPPSPLSPAIDRDRELLDFGLRRCRSRPTLEWACAAARVSGRSKDDDGGDQEMVDEMLPDASGGDTEDEMEDTPHEALTPSSSVESQNTIWKSRRLASVSTRPIVPVDVEATPRPSVKPMIEEDVMEAALALCGLG
ncbi:hypothetical protein PHLGIDRAFT_50338, partial [Phlebiopsis gigantea 11061_1 CR5-6]